MSIVLTIHILVNVIWI